MIETTQHPTTCSGGGGWHINGTADPVETLEDYTDSKYLYETCDTALLSDNFSTFDWSDITSDAYVESVTLGFYGSDSGSGTAARVLPSLPPGAERSTAALGRAQ